MSSRTPTVPGNGRAGEKKTLLTPSPGGSHPEDQLTLVLHPGHNSGPHSAESASHTPLAIPRHNWGYCMP